MINPSAITLIIGGGIDIGMNAYVEAYGCMDLIVLSGIHIIHIIYTVSSKFSLTITLNVYMLIEC